MKKKNIFQFQKKKTTQPFILFFNFNLPTFKLLYPTPITIYYMCIWENKIKYLILIDCAHKQHTRHFVDGINYNINRGINRFYPPTDEEVLYIIPRYDNNIILYFIHFIKSQTRRRRRHHYHRTYQV